MISCADIRRELAGGRTPAGAEVDQHLAICPACSELLADGAVLGRVLEAPGLPEVGGLFDELQRSLAAEARPLARLRSWRTPLRIGLALVGAAAAASVGLTSVRPDLPVYPPARLGLELLLVALIGAAGIWLWLRPIHRPAPTARAVALLALLALAVPWGLALAPQAHALHPASLVGGGADLLRRALPCFIYASVLGLPVALLVWLLGRYRRAPLLRGVLAISSGALAGLIALLLHCPITVRAHLLVGHATVVVAFALIGGLILLVRRRRAV